MLLRDQLAKMLPVHVVLLLVVLRALGLGFWILVEQVSLAKGWRDLVGITLVCRPGEAAGCWAAVSKLPGDRGPFVVALGFSSLAGHGVAVVARGTPGCSALVSPAAVQGQKHVLETASNRARVNFDDK